MEIEFSKLFAKNLDKMPKQAKQKFSKLYELAEQADSLEKLPNIKKLKGHKSIFRFRLGDYRVTGEVKGKQITFNNIAHRKDIYKDL